MYEPTTTTDQRLPKGVDRRAQPRSSVPRTPPVSAGGICAVCHLKIPIPARPGATETGAAFAVGTILAAIPLLFLLTTPGATQPGLWTRLAICTGGGLAGVLFQRRPRRLRTCPDCR